MTTETMTKSKIEPFADQIVVRPAEESSVSKGGILLPTGSKEKPTRGQVVAVGPGRYAPETGRRIPPDVTIGATVVYSKYAGTEVKVDDQTLVILREKDLLCALHEE